MGATTQLMTFEEFSKLPDEVCRRSELRHGELIEVPPPLKDHVWIQQRQAILHLCFNVVHAIPDAHLDPIIARCITSELVEGFFHHRLSSP